MNYWVTRCLWCIKSALCIIKASDTCLSFNLNIQLWGYKRGYKIWKSTIIIKSLRTWKFYFIFLDLKYGECFKSTGLLSTLFFLWNRWYEKITRMEIHKKVYFKTFPNALKSRDRDEIWQIPSYFIQTTQQESRVHW